MEHKTSKEKGILKASIRSGYETRSELTPQASFEHAPSSPHPSVDRLSVTWADPEDSMASGVNLFHLPSDTVINNEVKVSPIGDGSEDEDYSASLSAVLRQRRASVRRSRKGKSRRPSSPFLPDETRSRRRSSVFTTSSGDTAISIEECQSAIVTQEQIMENIHLHKEVLGAVKQQPYDMRRKLKIVHQAKSYIKRHEGQLQERLAQSKSTKDIYARFNILLATKWQQLKREAANMSNLMIPWELRIKEIESHFGSVVASYFTFLRWLFWVNLVIGFILLVFVIVPEYLTANPVQDGERKIILEDERRNATNLLTLWEFEGVLKCSPIFYGYYSNIDRPEYRMPLAYFLTGLAVYIYSFVATLRKMAENSRLSKLSEKEDECIFSWKLFTGWDFMIGNAETAHNRIASVILGFKEALLEEAEKKKDVRNWRIISLRALVNICVVILLAVSAYAVVTVVSRSDDNSKAHSWWRENETTIVVTVISITFPVFFELLGFLEHYHPRKQLRLQLARIMLLNLLNLYSLIFALFSKIEGMSNELDFLKPSLNASLTTDASTILNLTLDSNDTMDSNITYNCTEVRVPCMPCELFIHLPISSILTTVGVTTLKASPLKAYKKFSIRESTENPTQPIQNGKTTNYNAAANLIDLYTDSFENKISDNELDDVLFRIRQIVNLTINNTLTDDNSSEVNYDYSFEDSFSEPTQTTKIDYFSTVFDKSSSVVEYSKSTMEDNSTEDHNVTDYSTTEKYETLETLSTYPDFYNITSEAEEEFTTMFDYSTIPDEYLTQFHDLYNITESTPTDFNLNGILCPDMTFRCTINCSNVNMTYIYTIYNCTVVEKFCLVTKCFADSEDVGNIQNTSEKLLQTNVTLVDVVFLDSHDRKMYNLTIETKKKLLKLCWETMFGQELVKLTMMDLVFVLLGTLFMDFFRALFVRYMNKCWCWDLEKRFPEYGDFKIAENILHLINNQGMVWMGMFFSPGLVVLNVFKLVIMMYLRCWTVMTCNVPHEVVFRVSKSNNFYLALLLTMLFLCVLPVGYTIVWVKPSWHCGPFSEYEKIYHILTNNIYKILPKTLNFALEYIASPAIVIPLLVLLILIIYYLTSLTNSLREANNDLKIQLRRERTEERRKMFQLADTRRKGGSADNTPFARWKKALPTLPLNNRSIDSDDRKDMEDGTEIKRIPKKKGGLLAKIVGMALDHKTEVKEKSDENITPSPNADDETDTDFHESLPKDVLKIKDITVVDNPEMLKKRVSIDIKPEGKLRSLIGKIKVAAIKENETSGVIEVSGVHRKPKAEIVGAEEKRFSKDKGTSDDISEPCEKKVTKKQTSETSTQSKQSDSIGSVIPVITISTTESDDEVLQGRTGTKKEEIQISIEKVDVKTECKEQSKPKPVKKCSSDSKSLRRQSSVDSSKEHKLPKEMKSEQGHKYQYSL